MTDRELQGIAFLFGKLLRETKQELRAEFQRDIAGIPKPERGERGIDGPPGPQGPPGERGPSGESVEGPIGPQGERGERGATGAIGDRGERGIDGKDGRDGREAKDGRDGENGRPGRDALEIDILRNIELGKLHPRGTFAHYRGGIVRSIRDTNSTPSESMNDWEVVVRGTPEFTVTQSEDLRSFTFSYRSTDGAEQMQTFSIPVMIHRGIWRQENAYVRGDCVTWAGSIWHCIVESTQDKPGEGSSAWQLAVKKGQDLR
jgi:hypothetical protein